MILNRLRAKTDRLIGRKTIVQFGPPRSGSTLVYNILRDLFPDRSIEKAHRYRRDDLGIPVVATYRHPLDCIASSIQRYGRFPTNDVIEQQISEFEENGIWDILRIKDNSNVLLLRYEEFVYDFQVIFNGIEGFFDVKILPETRNVLTERYQIEAVEEIVARMGSFAEYDTRTLWHGKHISKYKGAPFYYKTFFQDDQIAYLEGVYNKFLLEFNYL